MELLNIEIKAKCNNKDHIRKILEEKKADFKGIDFQTDIYFKCNKGRLKLREGNIEYSFVYYDRENKSGPKKSEVIYYHPLKNTALKAILTSSLGILVTVKKQREIYFIDNIKIHIDKVNNLGSFIEIEAIDESGKIGEVNLRKQCKKYLDLFEIHDEDLINCSYSDMILKL
jgi:predicted adenylyl cyclase CyaB